MVAEFFLNMLKMAGIWVGIMGIFIIITGIVKSFYQYIIAEFDNERNDRQFDTIRYNLGKYLLLWLEFLIAADILETIFDPTLEHIAILGGIVVIRTILNFFLNRELDHIKHYIKR